MNQENENSAIDIVRPYERALSMTKVNLRITDKLLSLYFSEEQKELIDFLIVRSTEKHFFFTNKILSKYYPLSESLIEQYKDKLDWGWKGLSCNEALNWDINLIERYKDRWDWYYLSSNRNINWDINLIEKYKDRWNWNWEGLSCNEALNWDIYLIEKYKDRWDWILLGFVGDGKDQVIENFPWSINLVEKYKNRWGNDWWHDVSANGIPCTPWSTELIHRFHNYWDWEQLIDNEDILLDYEKLEPYIDIWFNDEDKESLKWEFIARRVDFRNNPDLIEKFKDKEGFFEALSRNPYLPWSIYLIERYKDKWSWRGLSENKGIHFDEEIINKFWNRWDTGGLLFNSKVPQPLLLKILRSELEKVVTVDDNDSLWYSALCYESAIKWDEETIIQFIDSIPMEAIEFCEVSLSEDFFERFENRIVFSKMGAHFVELWSDAFIEKYEDKWDWYSLNRFLGRLRRSGNHYFPSFRLLQKYKDRWDLGKIIYFNERRARYNENIPWNLDFFNYLGEEIELRPLEDFYNKMIKASINDKMVKAIFDKVQPNCSGS